MLNSYDLAHAFIQNPDSPQSKESPMRSVRIAPKRPINLSLNTKVLEMAKEMGMNISRTVDELLSEAVMKRYWANWQQQNQLAIDSYNDRIEREGLFSDRYRSFMRTKPVKDAA